MALPSSGQISISQIRTELGTSDGSLRNLSALAGFSSPDAMSEFYGYSNVSTVYIDYSLPSYASCYNYYTFGAYTGGTNVNTDVTIDINWYGDLGGYMNGTVTIFTGTACNNNYNVYSGGSISCFGENFSYASATVYPSLSGNHYYQPGGQLAFYAC